MRVSLNFIKGVFILFFLITISRSYAQDKVKYKIDGVGIEEMLVLFKRKPPVVFTLTSYQEMQEKVVSIKKKSEKYIKIENQIREIQKEKDKIDEDYQIVLEKYNEINQVVSNINSFLQSQKPFHLKKDFLKEAQSKAMRHEIKDLIYADNDFNTKRKSRFLVLSLNKMDLRIHLHRIIHKIKSQNHKPEKPFFDDNKLLELKEALSNTPSFYYVKSVEKRKDKKVKKVKEQLKSFTVFSGAYQDLGICYVLMSSYKDKLVDKQVIAKKDLVSMDIDPLDLDGFEMHLIKSLESDISYLVGDDFIYDYARAF